MILKQLYQLFVANGANINAIDNKGKTPLHYCSKDSDVTSCLLAGLLLADGADVNSIDKKGRTPLHYHIEQHDKLDQVCLKMIEIFISKESNLKAVDKNGAKQGKYFECIMKLLTPKE